MDFPAKSLAAILVIKCGRRWPYIILMVSCGVSFLLMLAFNRGDYANDWPIVTFAMLGNFFISTSFAIIWVYTAELFPTNVRLVLKIMQVFVENVIYPDTNLMQPNVFYPVSETQDLVRVPWLLESAVFWQTRLENLLNFT